ncbi:MAG: DUF58 domain-containing protein [Bacteroidia bacterium]|nr:DUF58 domain-containing protein [Bacteroidia bacterium]
METTDLLRKVRKIEIKTRGLSSQIFSGEYHSAFKGRGMAFSEVREYMPGDDIRSIDWNVTARFNHPYVKVFEEERELTVMLLVDVSGSGSFGTRKQLKRDLITELCAVLSFSAIQNNDKAGVIFFSDKIELFIPPKKGKTHILRIIRELINLEPESHGTDLGMALRYFTNMIKKRSIAFVISDFKSKNFEDSLKIASRKHDTVAIRIADRHEKHLPDVGLVRMQDAETGQFRWVDTSSAAVRLRFEQWNRTYTAQLESMFNRSGIDHTVIETGMNYVTPLINLFKARERRF